MNETEEMEDLDPMENSTPTILEQPLNGYLYCRQGDQTYPETIHVFVATKDKARADFLYCNLDLEKADSIEAISLTWDNGITPQHECSLQEMGIIMRRENIIHLASNQDNANAKKLTGYLELNLDNFMFIDQHWMINRIK